MRMTTRVAQDSIESAYDTENLKSFPKVQAKHVQ